MLLVTESILSKQVLILQGTTEVMVYEVGIFCRLWLAARNSNGIVIVGMYPCTQLAGCWCGLWLAVVFGQGSPLANDGANKKNSHNLWMDFMIGFQ